MYFPKPSRPLPHSSLAHSGGPLNYRIITASSLLAALTIAGTNIARSAAPAITNMNLVANGDFEQSGGAAPTGFTITGGATYGYLGDRRRDMSSMGIALNSMKPDGSLTCTAAVTPSSDPATRWYRLNFHGLPQDGFALSADRLYVKIEFFGNAGATAYDGKEKLLYSAVQTARKDLAVNGVRHRNGAEVWRDYPVEFMLPFAQVDQLKITVGFDHGNATSASNSSFYVDDLSLTHIDAPTNVPTPATQPTTVAAVGKLLPLGGRWFYAARDGETAPPSTFDASNGDRLLYHDAVYSAPFAGNMTATLRAGDKDLNGNIVTANRTITDNVTVHIDGSTMIIHSHGVPNHPTGRFPEQGFGNPSYITEQTETFYIPLNPQVNPKHFTTTDNNSNHALPMGPIGIAVNGVVFFNPFDMGNTDATNMMDRCCGHPNQMGQYHYHKYPICVNSPWADEGDAHSPVIGFAFDGFPLYGPYEGKGVMAKDVTGEHALNDFNLHFDEARGWHYHVTPGKFPYLLGGYWGTEDSRDDQRPRRGGPGGGGGEGGRMGPPGGGPPPMFGR